MSGEDPDINSVSVEECQLVWNGKEWVVTYKTHEKEAKDAGRPTWRDENMSHDHLKLRRPLFSC